MNQEPVPVYQPTIAEASEEGAQRIGAFRLPPGFEVSLWAAEPDLANPVAFCFDQHGAVYVAETFRQETEGVPDNRSHRYWLEDDLRLQSVTERAVMYLKHHPEYASEWTDQHDRIRKLVDLDGDGRADRSTVYADGFNGLLDGTGSGVLARGKDLWFTCIPHLWWLRDDDGDGRADQRRALHTGYGVRVAFRGHDMHGLVMGPDGKLYFSIGDRGYNVVTQEGERLKEPGRGAVFRCNLDGSGLEVYAIGLRNPQELAFDDYGNLWTGDNNCDAGDQARLVYVMEGGDCGWSMNFQYLPDRGPWMSESWWKPRFDGQPAFLNPPIVNMTSGPSGLAHYPGVGLPESYRGSLFLCDFTGGPGSSSVHRFNFNPDGAGYALNEHEKFWQGILVTDFDFAPDGSMMASDWVAGWVGAGKGRLYRAVHSETGDTELTRQTARLLGEGFEQRSNDALIELLAHADRRVRLEAQYVLMARGESALAGLAELATSNAATLPRIHACWALAALGAGGKLAELLDDADAEVRAQAAKGIGECRFPAVDALIAALGDDNARVRYFAAQSLGKLGNPRATAPLLELLRTNADQDRFLRHAASFALGRIGDRSALRAKANAVVAQNSASLRLGALLALRTMGDPAVADFLADPDPFLATEAAIAIYDKPIDAALPALADLLPRCVIASAILPRGGARAGSEILPAPLVRRALHAANRRGGLADWNAVAALVADTRYAKNLRQEAAQVLADWPQPAEFDRLRNQSRRYAVRDTGALRKRLAEVYPHLLALKENEIRLRMMRALQGLRVQQAGDALATLAGNEQAPPAQRSQALKTLAALDAPAFAAALAQCARAENPEVRGQAIALLATSGSQQALPVLRDLLPNASPSDQARCFEALALLDDPEADGVLAQWMDRLTAGEVADEISLELWEAAQSRTQHQGVRAAVARFQAQLDVGDDLGHYRLSMHGGDAARGRKIFFDNPVASCQRCHFVQGHSSGGAPPEVGPELSGAGLKGGRAYLLRSILDPTADIASGFEVYDGDGKMLPTSAMTPALGMLLSGREIRDLIAYLDSLRRPAKLVVLVHSAGYEHAVARAAEGGGPSLVERSWSAWAADDARFEVETVRDPNWFTAEKLKQVDAVFFYTTGELPMAESSRTALQQFVEQGGGFVGAHCATDTFYQWPWYGKMIGGYFDGHPWTADSNVGVLVEDQQHSATRHWPERFRITDEIYQLKEPYARTLQHVLLKLDTANTDMSKNGIHRTDDDFAIAWSKRQGLGRVFYTSLGHRADVWTNPDYRTHLVLGALWAAGR